MKYWVTFVGEGRCGHTVISGILGSHLNIRMTEEQKYISKWFTRKHSRDLILRSLLMSQAGRARNEQGWTNLTTFREPLLIVGDKCGWDAVNEVARRGAPFDIITKFGEYMEMPVKVIHTSRNPLDNISAWVQSPKYQRMFGDEGLRYRRMIRRYKRFYEHAERVMEGQDVFQLRHEELIANPSVVIQKLSNWLELEPNREWRRESASRIYTKPNRRSLNLQWPEEYVRRVVDFIEETPSLHYYRDING